MLKVQKDKIKVHKFLHELFGYETTRFDLVAIVIASVSLASLTLLFKWNEDFSIIIPHAARFCALENS